MGLAVAVLPGYSGLEHRHMELGVDVRMHKAKQAMNAIKSTMLYDVRNGTVYNGVEYTPAQLSGDPLTAELGNWIESKYNFITDI